jgi:nucleosome assembly protein 1-like 1
MSDCGSSDGEVDYSPCIDISSLPVVVQNRVKALKNLQLETVKAECEYYKEVHQLDVKYQKVYDEINKKREVVLSGAYEPSGAEIEWKNKEEESEAGGDTEAITNGIEKLKVLDMDENTKGIPKFWMNAMKNANDECLMGMVEDHDEAVLEYLTDITVQLNQEQNNGFTLRFHFKENPYMSNSVLTKVYTLREDPDPESPLEYDGPEIISCKGCPIDWKAGKDVTKTVLKLKKLKPKKGKNAPDKEITKEVKADSFFNFFSPPEHTEGKEEDMTDEDRATLAMDFDVGFAIKEKIVPRAVLYYTGEAFDEDDDEFEDLDTEEEEGEDSDEDLD